MDLWNRVKFGLIEFGESQILQYYKNGKSRYLSDFQSIPTASLDCFAVLVLIRIQCGQVGCGIVWLA